MQNYRWDGWALTMNLDAQRLAETARKMTSLLDREFDGVTEAHGGAA
jgi:hypothetical protein